MTVYDFLFLALEDYYSCAVYDFAKNDSVFDGTIEDVKDSEFSDYEILSFDIFDNGKLTVNIYTNGKY